MIAWDIISAMFITLIFMAVWAVGRWTSRLYVVTQGAFWLPSLAALLILFLVLTALIPSRSERLKAPPETSLLKKKFYAKRRFWVVMAFLMIFIVSGYTMYWKKSYQPGSDALKHYMGPDTLERWKK